jgi:hypothetical protein
MSSSSNSNQNVRLDIVNNAAAINNNANAITNELLASNNHAVAIGNNGLAIKNNTSAIGNNAFAINNNALQIEQVRKGIATGVVVFATKALLDAHTPIDTTQENGSFKVTNDPTSDNNGYYAWVIGTTYTKDYDLVVNVVDAANTSEAVSGAAVHAELIKKPSMVVDKNLFDSAACSVGYLRTGDAVLVNDADSLASDYIPVIGGADYTISGRNLTGTKIIAFYDVDSVLLPAIGADYEDVPLNGTVTAPVGAAFVRFTVALNGSGDTQLVQFEKGSVATQHEPFGLVIPASQVKTTAKNSDFFSPSINLFDHKTMVTYDSFLNNSNGVVTAGVGWAFASVPINNIDNQYFAIRNALTDVSVNDDVVHFFNDAGTRISTSTSLNGVIPDDTVLFKFNIASTANYWEKVKKTAQVENRNVVGDYVAHSKNQRVLNEYVPTTKNLLDGKLITWVGDSIVRADNLVGWCDLANKSTGAANVKKADHGATITNQYPTTACMSGSLLTYNYDVNSDVTIFLGGTNDFGYDLPLGDDAQMLASTDTTVKGSLYKAIQWVKDNNQSSKILVATPLERSTSAQNGIGLYLSDYRAAIIEVCIAHSVPYVDNYNVNLISMPTAYKYLIDGLHPNDAGYAVSYDKIEEAIIELFS